MIICLNARNQENILSGSTEKMHHRWMHTEIYIKIQKHLQEIKIAAFVHSAESKLLSKAKRRSIPEKKIEGNRGGCGMLETFI